MNKSKTPRKNSQFKKLLTSNIDQVITQFQNQDSYQYFNNQQKQVSLSQHLLCSNNQSQQQQSLNITNQPKTQLFQDVKSKFNNNQISNLIIINPHIKLIQDKYGTIQNVGLKSKQQKQYQLNNKPSTPAQQSKKNIHLEGFSYSSRLYAPIGDKFQNQNEYSIKPDTVRSRSSVGTILITKSTKFQDIVNEFKKKRDENIKQMNRYHDEEHSPVHNNEYFQQRQRTLKISTQSSLNVQFIQTTQGSPRVQTTRHDKRYQNQNTNQAVLNKFLIRCQSATKHTTNKKLKIQPLNVQFQDQVENINNNQQIPFTQRTNTVSYDQPNTQKNPEKFSDYLQENLGLNLENIQQKGQQITQEKQEQQENQEKKENKESQEITKLQCYKKLQDQDLFSQIANVWNEETKFEMKMRLKAKKQEIKELFNSNSKQVAQFKQLRIQLKDRLYKLQKINVTFTEKLTDQIFSEKPFQRNGSFIFFKAIKSNNTNLVIEMLNNSPFYVFDFDQFKHTALHMATIKNYEEMVRLLLDRGADPDALDIAKRPSLFYAIQNKNYVIIKLLITNLASPWSPQGIDYYEFANDPNINRLIKRARYFYFLIKMAPPEYRKYLRTVEKDKYFEI